MKSRVLTVSCVWALAMGACGGQPKVGADFEDGALHGEGGEPGDGDPTGDGGSSGDGDASSTGGTPGAGGSEGDGGNASSGGGSSGGSEGDGGSGDDGGWGGEPQTDGGSAGGTGGDGSGGSSSGGASSSDGSSGGGSGDDGAGGSEAAGGTSSDGGAGGGGGTGGDGSGGDGTGGDGNGGDLSLDPEHLFTTEEFGGNGRTCTTCHTAETGTISPDQIQSLFITDPDDPMFRPIDSDDGEGDDYSILLDRATFRVELDLHPDVYLSDDPGAPTIVLRRSVPTTINTPALDTTLMWDGRAPDLMEQALGAILGHAEAAITPTFEQLEAIAEFEQGFDFFSSAVLREYAQGGPAPTWPPGNTEAEVRGRRWFAPDTSGNAFAARFNVCGQCHGGPMTNETQANSGLPVGEHFQTVNVSEFNTMGNPTYEFVFPDPNNPGEIVTVVTPDPGRALITGDVRDVNFFKIPPLWGVKDTAPYFHDNSAATLEELMEHYEDHLATFLSSNPAFAVFPFPHVPTAQDKADIIAYLLLL